MSCLTKHHFEGLLRVASVFPWRTPSRWWWVFRLRDHGYFSYESCRLYSISARIVWIPAVHY